jgi:hypothetical protein
VSSLCRSGRCVSISGKRCAVTYACVATLYTVVTVSSDVFILINKFPQRRPASQNKTRGESYVVEGYCEVCGRNGGRFVTLYVVYDTYVATTNRRKSCQTLWEFGMGVD